MHYSRTGIFGFDNPLLEQSLDMTETVAKWNIDFRTLNTGDLILFESHGWIQRWIQIQSRSSVTHVGLVIAPHGERPKLWTSMFTASYPPLPGEESRSGCVLVNLEEFLDWVHGEGDKVRLRRLRGRVEIADEVSSGVIRKYLHRPFPSRLSLIPRFAMGLARVSTFDRTIFCSELVALSLSEMEVIDLSRPANGYTPAHFSHERQRLKMKGTCEYGEEEELT